MKNAGSSGIIGFFVIYLLDMRAVISKQSGESNQTKHYLIPVL